MKKLKHWQKVSLIIGIFDIFAVNMAYFFALLLRFDFEYTKISSFYLDAFIKFAPFYTIFSILTFYFLKMYKSMWRFASVAELVRSSYAFVITTTFHVLGTILFIRRMPISYYIIGAIAQYILVTSIRLSYRVYLILTRATNNNREVERVLIVGAGEAGRLIYNDIINYEEKNYKVVGFLDDNPNKWGRYISNLPIFGEIDIVEEIAEKHNIDLIIIAVPSLDSRAKQIIINKCNEAGAKLKIAPSIPEMITSDKITVKELKDVEIEDLLEREPIKINNESALRNITGKVVLVTGGGGTIGSELCRQIASHNPKQLLIFDIYENNAYEIEQELKRKYPKLNLVALIGSVREELRVDDVFHKYRPNIVYHAAAHKHVPLMEISPNEAIKNNIYGTYNTAYAALRYNAERFILISTDKAVNPTSIMGATKRICEMIIQSMSTVSKTKNLSMIPELKAINNREIREFNSKFITDFVAVRFGNVLGSNGSVVPLFKKQIAEGGPITVTHKDIIRYFMTISEAVSLVIEAGFYAKGGEIFVLDMGEPVKIDTLARNLIKLSGLKPDKDINIEYVGLRPGEKLYEEKLMSEEGLEKTPNDLIHIAKPINFNNEVFFKQLEDMSQYSAYNLVENVVEKIMEIVPNYHSSESDIENNKDKFEELYRNSK